VAALVVHPHVDEQDDAGAGEDYDLGQDRQ
jgi:hypothetical protein